MSAQQDVAEIRAKLGNVSFDFSHAIESIDIYVDRWRDAGLTRARIDRPLSFMLENNTLHLIALMSRPARSMSTNLIEIEDGFCSNIPGEAFRGSVEDPIDVVNIFISPSLIEETLGIRYSADVAARNLRSVRSAAPLRHLATALFEDAKTGSATGPLLGESIISAMISVAHPVEIGKLERSERRHAPLSAGSLNAVRDLIHNRLAASLHLEGLAKIAGMSVRQFSRAFLQSTGFTPHQYIIRARLDAARGLIGRSMLSYDEIAWTVGFADRNHMATVFRKTLGVPPSHFRRA